MRGGKCSWGASAGEGTVAIWLPTFEMPYYWTTVGNQFGLTDPIQGRFNLTNYQARSYRTKWDDLDDAASATFAIPWNWSGNPINGTLYAVLEADSSIGTHEWLLAAHAHTQDDNIQAPGPTFDDSYSFTEDTGMELHIIGPQEITIDNNPSAGDWVVLNLKRADSFSGNPLTFAMLVEIPVILT